jgi:hypothetical protein
MPARNVSAGASAASPAGGVPVSGEDSLCGPRALATAAMLDGIPVSMDSLVDQFQLQSAGTSLHEVKRVAERIGLRSVGVRLDWDELQRQSTPAILFVSGDHFVVVDPKDTRAGDHGLELRLYDPPGLARYVSRPELDGIWNGAALLVGKAAGSSGSGAARARASFESLLFDFGVRGDSHIVSHSFAFRNEGAEPLEILGIEQSCGCTSVSASKDSIPPGDEGRIEVSMDPGGKRGKQVESVTLHTNDPLHPTVTLLLQGWIDRNIYVTRKSLAFHGLTRGADFQDRFEVWSKNPVSLRLESENTPDAVESMSLSVEEIGRRVDPSTGEHVTEYALKGRVGSDTNEKDGKAEVVVSMNNDPKTGIRIPISISISSDVALLPEILSFGVVYPGMVCKREITVKRSSREKLAASQVKCSIEADPSSIGRPEISNLREEGETLVAELTLHVPDDLNLSGQRLSTGKIIVELESNDRATAEWAFLFRAQPST